MKKIKHFLFTVAALLCSMSASAHHSFEKGGIYYSIVSSTNTVKVTFRGNSQSDYYNEYYGSFAIPETVTYNGKTYSVTNIGDHAFCYCPGLTSVTIPNSVTSIGGHAFYGCSGLTSVTIPNSVTSIGEDAFSDCYGLTSVTIGNSVTSIGESAFHNCSNLKEVHISDIAAWCKIDFEGLESNPLYYAKHLFFYSIKIKDLVIPNSVTSIGQYAFSRCDGLTSVTIPNSVTSIGEYAFAGCSGLTSVTIPNSVTSIGKFAFSDCKGLTSVTIGNSVTSIGSYAFCNCSNLTTVTIGNSVTSIGGYAFYNCFELTDVYCYAEQVPSTNSFAFASSDAKYTTIHVPATSIEDYKATAPWSHFRTIVALTEEETGIEDIVVEDININNAPVYNLQGMKMQNVDNLPAGIYIKGGKKYLAK